MIGLLAAGGLLYLLTRKKKKMTDLDSILPDVEKFILKSEGGLSNNPNDPAAKNPSPTSEKWHTNKGVTWSTFVSLAPKLGYQPTVQNFLVMPSSIWQKIYLEKYLKKAQISDNPLINAYLSIWYWQGYDTRLLDPKKITAVIASKMPLKKKLADLVALRKQYYDQVIANNPKTAVFKKGWYNSADNFYKTFEKLT